VCGGLIPAAFVTNVRTFAQGGYVALYANQAQYSFGWLRLLDFIVPALFGLAVLLKERKYMFVVLCTTLGYVLAGLIVGQRAAFGQCFLVGLWYTTELRRIRIPSWAIVLLASAAIAMFQVVVGWREGYQTSVTLAQFMIDQGITFLLPTLAINSPSPPVHTIVSSLMPLGGLYSVLGIGTAETKSLGSFLSSTLDSARFQSGYGVGGTFYLEIFCASGGVWVAFAVLCVAMGSILRKWEDAARKNATALFYLCICAPSIIILPRGTISAVSATIIYVSIYMVIVYCFQLSLRFHPMLPHRGTQPSSSIQGA
jgi:hypothetical protein